MATTAQGNRGTMENDMDGYGRWWNILRIVGWSLAALILLSPLVAMLFTNEVNWGPEDFLFAGVLLGGSGLLFEGVMRRSDDDAYRTGALLAIAGMFLLIWSNAAVGFVGSGANAANVLYFALLAIPIIGGIVSGFRAQGLFLTLIGTAAAQAAIAVFAFATGLVNADERHVLLAINAIFILLWLGSAVLFHQAAEQNATLVVGTGSNATPLRRSPIQFVLSLLLMAIGTVMVVYMIIVESEPGMVPLLILLLGMVWFSVTVFRSKASHDKQ